MSWGAKNQNNNRIHIALTGNFENEHPTSAQINSVRQLIADIRQRRNISSSHIFTHRQIPNQSTLCAGRNLNFNTILTELIPTKPLINPNNTKVHIVQKSETLSRIALKHNSS